MILAIVRFPLPTPLPSDETQRRAEATTSLYEIVSALHKHYLHGDDDRMWGAVYVWGS